MRRAAFEALGYCEAKVPKKKSKVSAKDPNADARMIYSVHDRYLSKLQKVWAKFGLDVEKGDWTDEPDEREYVLRGTVDTLTKFYRSTFNTEPEDWEIVLESRFSDGACVLEVLGYGPVTEARIKIATDTEWNEALYQIKKVKEGIIGAGMRGKPKDREWAARATQHVADLEAAVRDYEGRMQTAHQAAVRGAGDSGYGELPYNAAIAQRWLGEPSGSLYRSAQNSALKALASGGAKFFLRDKSGLWAVLWVAVDGKEMQLSKKKMTLKDINGVLNGDFYHPIPGG